MTPTDREALATLLRRGIEEVESSEHLVYVKLTPAEARACVSALTHRQADTTGGADQEAAQDQRTHEERGMDAYNGWCNHQPMHTNRLPSWSELSKVEQKQWIRRAAITKAGQADTDKGVL